MGGRSSNLTVVHTALCEVNNSKVFVTLQHDTIQSACTQQLADSKLNLRNGTQKNKKSN